MTPDFSIVVNGADVSAHVRANLVEVGFEDRAGDEADEAVIKVFGDFARPAYMDKLVLQLGSAENGLFPCGTFYVQTTDRDHVNNILEISAASANLTDIMKEPRSASWENITLAKIADKIAKRYALDLKSDTSDITISHLPQTRESDIAFLNRLATVYHCVFQIKNGTLILMNKTKEQTASSDIPIYTLDRSECSTLSISRGSRRLYHSVQAVYHNSRGRKAVRVKVGAGRPIYDLYGHWKSDADARIAAEKKLASLTAHTVTGSIETEGQPIYAGGRLNLTGAGEDSGVYSILSCSHRLRPGSYTMDIEIQYIYPAAT